MTIKPKNKQFIFSVDVDWVPGTETGVIDLLDFCDNNNLPSTFFVTGKFAENYPNIVRMIAERGHQVGTHGWEHGQKTKDDEEDFQIAPSFQQKYWLEMSTEAVAKATGTRPVAFRAPNLRVSENTLIILEELGYRYDSSVPSRRITLGYGKINKLSSFFAPQNPYYPSIRNIGLRGNSRVLEVPPSSMILPLNMSVMRVFGFNVMKWIIDWFSYKNIVLTFYAHPSEFVLPEKQIMPSDNPARYLKGIGPQHFDKLRRLVNYIINLGFNPISIKNIKV